MTPCEEKGYRVGDRFRVTDIGAFSKGSIIKLECDDTTCSPLFKLISGECIFHLSKNGEEGAYIHLDSVEKISNKESDESPAPTAKYPVCVYIAGVGRADYSAIYDTLYNLVGGDDDHEPKDYEQYVQDQFQKYIGIDECGNIIHFYHKESYGRGAYSAIVYTDFRQFFTDYGVTVDDSIDDCTSETNSEEWDGEGIPPVGTICEYQLRERFDPSDDDEWCECEIMYVGSGDVIGRKVVVEVSNNGITIEYAFNVTEATFRRIDPESNEHDRAINEMVETTLYCHNMVQAMETLYNNGWRKQ